MNGTWNLFIVDDSAGNVGQLAGGVSDYLAERRVDPHELTARIDEGHPGACRVKSTLEEEIWVMEGIFKGHTISLFSRKQAQTVSNFRLSPLR